MTHVEIIPVGRRSGLVPAAEGHNLWPWMSVVAFDRDVAPPGREVDLYVSTGVARGDPPADHSKK
jgi:hypothetical protein